MPPLPKLPPLNLPPLPALPSPTGLTAEFLSNPLKFMRVHSVSPPHDSGVSSGWDGELGTVASQVNVPGTAFKKGEKSSNPDVTVERRTGAGGVRLFQMVSHPDPNFPGAVTLKIAPAAFKQDGFYVPVYWLPWKNLKLISFALPGVPHSLVDWEDHDYPRFFFTAGINGCSVFAQGHPESPTITHAGLELTLKESAGKFWHRMMQATKAGYSAAAIRGEINSADYMARSSKHVKLMEEYRKFLDGGSKEFHLEVQSPFGCVFGIRYGRSWTLYLQKSVIYSKTRFYTAADLDIRPTANPQVSRAFLAGTNTFVKQTTEKKRFGKELQVYSVASQFSKPIQVMEMYPNKRYVADLKDLVTGG